MDISLCQETLVINVESQLMQCLPCSEAVNLLENQKETFFVFSKKGQYQELQNRVSI